MGYYYFGVLLPHSRVIQLAAHAAGGYSFGNDFYPIWLTARECLRHHRSPYSAEITQQIQIGLFGRVLSAANPGDPSPDYRAFSYPAFIDLPASVLARLSFPAARMLMAILLPLLTAASVMLWARALDWKASPACLTILVVLTLFSYPGLAALFAQQVGLAVGFLLAGAISALTNSKPGWAGCLLAFATVKPQMSALLIFCLLLWAFAKWGERWKLAAGFAATLALMTFSAWLVWPNWIGSWVHVMLNYRNYSRPPLLGYLFGHYVGVALIGLALAGSFAYAWRMRSAPPTSAQFRITIALTLAVTTVALLPEHAVYDHVILLPGIIMVLRSWRQLWAANPPVRWILVLAAVVLFWPWVAALFVDAARLSVAPLATTILFLPLRTAAAIPFVVLALLVMVGRRETSSGEPSY